MYSPAFRGEGECEPGHYRGQCSSALKKRTPSYSNDHLSACGQIKIHRRKTQAISEDEAQTASQHLIPFCLLPNTV